MIPSHTNLHTNTHAHTQLYDNVQNDDCAMIAFLQPWRKDYLTSAVCVVSAMLSDKQGGSVHTLVRGLECEYVSTCAHIDVLV